MFNILQIYDCEDPTECSGPEVHLAMKARAVDSWDAANSTPSREQFSLILQILPRGHLKNGKLWVLAICNKIAKKSLILV